MTRPATTLKVIQGATLSAVLQAYNFEGSLPINYLSSDTLSGTVFLTSGVPLLTFTPTWYDFTTGKIGVKLTASQTGNLSVGSLYTLQAFVTRATEPYGGAWTNLEIEPAA